MSIIKRTAKINKALDELKQSARTDIARRGILHFRINEANVLELYEIAANKKKALGTMIREWVLERLKQEQNGGPNDKLHDLDERLKALEKRWSQSKKRAKG
jgi:hypothetical protein